MAELKTWIQQRGSIKGRITVFQKHLEATKLIDSNNFSDVLLGELKIKLSRFQDMFSSFDDIQNNIELLCEDLDSQIEERDQLESSFCKLVLAENIVTSLQKIQGHGKDTAVDAISSRCSEVSRSSGNNYSFKLPTIKLPTFDGNHLKWLE